MKKVTTKWGADWFIDLSNEHKLFFDYLIEKADSKNTLKPTTKAFKALTEIDIELEAFFVAINANGERIRKLENGNWLVKTGGGTFRYTQKEDAPTGRQPTKKAATKKAKKSILKS